MKHKYTILTILTIFLIKVGVSQNPQSSYINYQGVAMDASGQVFSNETLTMDIALKWGAPTAANQYVESHNIQTNANGVFSLQIGKGTPTQGDYHNLPWGSGATYLTVSLNGTEIGTTEMNAVPHALTAANVQWEIKGAQVVNKNFGEVHIDGTFSLDAGETVNEISSDGNMTANSDAILPTQKAVKSYVDAHSGGGGGSDNQNLILTGDVLSIENGDGTVDLSTYVDDSDANPTNELQDISLSGTEISISDGSTVDLAPILPPGGTDDQKADEVPYDNSVSGLTATDTQAALDEIASGGLVDTDDQGLILSGDVLTIEDGSGSVDLSNYIDDADADPTNEIDVTGETGILLGDGAAVSGLVGTVDGQVPKWNAGSSTWIAGTDATGGGGSGTPTGLEALDEGSGTGWRLIGKDPTRYGDIGENATDLSSGDHGSNTHGATGEVSTAMGQGTTASGPWSTAMGYYTISSDTGSTAMGVETNASGYASTTSGDGSNASGSVATALGGSTSASGSYATAMGLGTDADAYISTAIGSFNIGGGDAETWKAGDPLFEIGNGTSTTPANAFTVLKNGNVGIGTETPVVPLEIYSSVQRQMVLESTDNRNYMQYITPNGFIGYSGVWSGNQDIDFGTTTSNTTGKVHLTTMASPKLTVIANGQVGIGNTNPDEDFVIGSNLGSGWAIPAATIGDGTGGAVEVGTPDISLQMSASTTFGRARIVSNSSDGFGRGYIEVRGIQLNVGRAPGVNTNRGYPLRVVQNISGFGGNYGLNLVNGTNEVENWELYVGASGSPDGDLFLYHNNASRGRFDSATGAYSATSDARLKTNIGKLESILRKFAQLKPKRYAYKTDKETPVNGFLAQDLLTVFPEVVGEIPGKNGEASIYVVDHAQLISITVAAVQEQQEIIDAQEQRIAAMEERLLKLEKAQD